MTVIAGIDEAGYGPLLGPLTVAAAAFRVQGDPREVDLWEKLSTVLCKRPREAKGRLTIADSKKVYHRSSGIRRLEEGVLAFMMSAGKRPKTFRDLLTVVGAPCMKEGVLEGYPWYRGRDMDLPRQATRPKIVEQADALARAAADAGVEYIGARCTPTPVAELNHMFAQTRNKSLALWSINAHLLWGLWRRFAAEGLDVVLDKHGARTRYTHLLMTAFPDASLKVEAESAEMSRYLLSAGKSWMRMTITSGAEDKSLPAALASMHAKYIREVFMEMFNAFWLERNDQLKTTAGYRQDGKRFLEDIQPLLEQTPHHQSQLTRNL